MISRVVKFNVQSWGVILRILESESLPTNYHSLFITKKHWLHFEYIYDLSLGVREICLGRDSLILYCYLVIDSCSLNLVVNGSHILLITVDHDEDLPRITTILRNSSVFRATERIRIRMLRERRALRFLIEGSNDNFM